MIPHFIQTGFNMPASDQPDPAATSGSLRSAASGCGKAKGRRGEKDSAAAKRRCVSTACIACRRRKSKVGPLLFVEPTWLIAGAAVRRDPSELCCMCVGVWH